MSAAAVRSCRWTWARPGSEAAGRIDADRAEVIVTVGQPGIGGGDRIVVTRKVMKRE
jgi:hypothetical protein